MLHTSFESIRRWAATSSVWDDDKLRCESLSLRYRLASGQPVKALLPEIMGLTVAAIQRVHGLTPHDVQLRGGVQLCLGRIAEMKTGEGKTLTAMFPTVLFALRGLGCHVVTANDYLASRDADFARPVLACLGLNVGVVSQDTDPADRHAAYHRDVTYSTAKEVGFDFLRDRLGLHSTPVLRPLYFALVDEADSILIDEARTPLIIGLTTPQDEITLGCYHWAARHARDFEQQRDFRFDNHTRRLQLLPAGVFRVRSLPQDSATRQVSLQTLFHHIENAIRAQNDYHLDQHYAIVDGKVVIIDPFTGRPAEGRQWQGGLHQAIEAKEGLEISPDNRSAARITIQNLFLLYEQFTGMTGTAWSSRREFHRVYRKSVVRIPTHRPVQRVQLTPQVFAREDDKWNAIVQEISEMLSAGRSVLVGTRNVDASEVLSARLMDCNIRHQVLNARHIQREAGIVAEAGQVGRVTVATNMAGRGTDIKLAPEVIAAGGLHVILSEMHESSRIDWQLIGRGCRQGDLGSFRIFVSLDDELLRAAYQRQGHDRIRQKHPATGMLSSRKLQLFQRAQRLVERRHLSERVVLLRQQRDHRKQCQETGQDPYLSFVE
ncbi:MAG: translocase [Planctomycetaceae bacterium]|nr:translocase [Planctomycetaceae bacterium]